MDTWDISLSAVTGEAVARIAGGEAPDFDRARAPGTVPACVRTVFGLCSTTDTPTLGTRIHSVWPGIVEVIGHTRMFDYVEFLGEYAPFDLHDLDRSVSCG